MSQPVARLRRIAAAAAAGAVVGDDARMLATVLTRYLEGWAFEDACGLAGDWRGQEARDERDQALRSLASMLIPDDGDLADRVRAEVRRYARRWARTDQHRRQMPESYAGTIDQYLYAVFAAASRLAKPIPLGRTQLQKILTACGDCGTVPLRRPLRPTRRRANLDAAS